MALVVGSEKSGHGEPVAPYAGSGPVGIPDHRAQGGAIGRSRRLPLLYQISQRFLADNGEHNLAHDPIRFSERGVGDLEQEVLLAGHALNVIQQFAVDLALSPRADVVDGFDQ